MSADDIPNLDRLAIRWTIGDVRERGFEMLRYSIACAWKLFGPHPRYIVCVNTVPIAEAQRRTGPLPTGVEWRACTSVDVPEVLRAHARDDLIEGMGWKLAPLRVAPDCYELSLDNDCIIWALPQGMRRWLEEPRSFLLAEDVERYLGSFDAQCPPGAYNAGIRGLPPRETLDSSLEQVLRRAAQAHGDGFLLRSEIEEQGLQVAAMLSNDPVHLVRRSEVSICSPFWPRDLEPGSCGAHLVSMNAAHIPWNYFERPADEWLEEHWHRLQPTLAAYAGL